jgi:WD40 repeat protein
MTSTSTMPDLSNPFPGLRCFLSEEDYLFFGRHEQIEDLLRRLRTNRLVAVVGTSGSGKSSLVRAGLLPAVLGGGMAQAGSAWNIAVMRPGGSPLMHLARALCEAGLYDADAEDALFHLQATLSRSRNGLREAVRQSRAAAGSKMLLVVDQFEELFRFHRASATSQEEAIGFVNLLLHATQQPDENVYVVLTMRSDFLGECSQFLGLAEAVNDGEFLIPRMTRDQIQEAIEGPIRVRGADIAPRLLFRLLNDVQDSQDQLPVLQHALMRTWDLWQRMKDEGGRMKDEGRHQDAPDSSFILHPSSFGVPLDLEHYEATGGMQEALSRHADEVFEALPSDAHRTAAARIFKALTERGPDGRGIRRPTRLGQLVAIAAVKAPIVHRVIEAYRGPGVTFLMPPVTSPLDDSSVIDISHESLMRVWRRLRGWVEEEAQSARIYRRLHETADLHAEKRAGLYHGPDLQIALSWRDAGGPNGAWARQYGGGFDEALAFLDSSCAAAEREEKEREAARQRELERARQLAETQARAARLFKRFAAGLAVGLCLAVALTVWAFLLREEAKRQEAAASFYAAEANTQAKEASANAEKAETEAQAARKAEQEARERASAEAAAKALAQEERQRADANAKKAELEARSARKAEQEARERASAEAAAKALAQQETQRAEAEKKRAEEQLTRAEWLVYAGKLMLAQTDFETGNGAFALQYLHECQLSRRGWEHHYLWTRINAKQTFQVHTGMVWSVAYSPDGKRIVIGSQDNSAKVWDAENGRELLALKGHTTPVRSVAFSSDGKRIVSGAGDPGRQGEAKVWDAETGKELLALRGFIGEVWSVAFSPDDKRIVTGAGNRGGGQGQAKVWDAATGQELLDLKGHAAAVRGVAFSPDSKRIVTAVGLVDLATLGEAKVWDAGTGKELLALRGHTEGVHSAAFSPDGKRIVTGAGNPGRGEAKVWDAGTGRELLALKGHTDWVSSVAFSPDNRRIVTGGTDNTVRVWDAETGQEVLVLKGHTAGVASVAFSPDGRRIITGSGDKTVRVWDAEKGQGILTLRGQGGVRSVAFSPDGKRLVTGSDDQAAKVWDPATGRELLVLKGWVYAVAFSPDGTRIVTGEGVANNSAKVAAKAKVWDAGTGRELLALKGHTGWVRGVAFSPNGKRILTGSDDQSAKVWDAGTGQEVLSLKGHTGGVASVAFSSDGKRILTGGDSTARVWDAEKGHEVLVLKGHTHGVRSVAFSPDGKRIVTGSFDNTAKVWDAGTGQEVLALKGHKDWVNAVVFSPDGKRIVTGSEDRTVKVWDAQGGQELLTLKGHTSVVFSVAFSPDGKRLVTGSYDKTAKVWDADRAEGVQDKSVKTQ